MFAMARKSQEMRRLEVREVEVAADIAHLEKALANARVILRDVQTARRVLGELAGPAPGSISETGEPDTQDDDGQDADAPTEAGMTIGEMAVALLRNNPIGMTSNQILSEIQALWVPDLARTSLSPPLSRLKKKGIIYLDEDLWKITPIIEDGRLVPQ